MVYGGDQAYWGRINGIYNFQAFKDVFTPLTSAGIPLYTAIGNHELYAHSDQIFSRQPNAYQTAFTSNPDNGPTGL